MGCDIHSFAEKKVGDRYEMIPDLAPFDWRDYGMYGFLAGVRNYSAVPVLAQPRDLPDDLSPGVRERAEDWSADAHTHSWLSVTELLAFDYDKPVEDRRYTRQEAPNFFNGAATAEPGEGKSMPWREFLGDGFFTDLEKLKAAGAERVVFWFDN